MFPFIFQELNKQVKMMQAHEARLESESKRATEKCEREREKVCYGSERRQMLHAEVNLGQVFGVRHR